MSCTVAIVLELGLNVMVLKEVPSMVLKGIKVGIRVLK